MQKELYLAHASLPGDIILHMKDKTILIVDDDPYVRTLIERVFQREGAQVISADNSRDGVQLFYRHHPDLVILDIVMPGEDGWVTCRKIREVSNAPVMMLTSLRRDEDIVRGLELGADDFVVKPVSAVVLLARASALLRRVEPAVDVQELVDYDDGHLRIDPSQKQVFVHGKPVKLTPTEYRLLLYLYQYTGRTRTYQQILESVWGVGYQDAADYVHVYVSNLRHKIELDPRNPQYLVSHYGRGYQFTPPKS